MTAPTWPALSTRLVRTAGIAAALAVVVLICSIAWHREHKLVGDWGLALDDSWIHCTIARNLATGHGWSYNPDVPVQNSSGPLWTLLVAIGFKAFGAGVWVPKVLGFLCLLGCVALAGKLAWTLTGDAWASVAAALGAAGCDALLWHGLSGMETPLAALCVTASVDAFYCWKEGWRRFAWIALAALAVTARPEALVLLPVMGVAAWLRARPDNVKTMLRPLVVGSLVAAAVLVPYFVLNFSLSGSLFPTTFAAKAGNTGIVKALTNGDWKEALLAMSLYPYVWTVHTVSFLGRTNFAWLVAAAIGAWSVACGPRKMWAPGALLVLLPLVRGMAAPHVLPGVQNGRYVGCLLPMYFACVGAGVVALLRARPPWGAGSRHVSSVALLGLAALAIVSIIRLEIRLPATDPGPFASLLLMVGREPEHMLLLYQTQEKLGLVLAAGAALALFGGMWMPRRGGQAAGAAVALAGVIVAAGLVARLPTWYARNVRSIHQMDVELGKWVQAHVAAGEPIAVSDIGAIGFFGNHPLVDAVGLATPELTPYMTTKKLRTLIAMKKLHPHYFLLWPAWFPEWTSRPSLLAPVMRHAVDDRTVLGGSTTIIYEANWERFDRYYSDALLAKLDPPEAYSTFAGHWRRGLRNMMLMTRAQLYSKAAEMATEPADAVAAYRKALALDPTERDAWVGLLHGLSTQHDASGYSKSVQEMAQRLPTSSEALTLLGDWQASAGQIEPAARSYERALALRPDDVGLLAKLESYARARGSAAQAESYRAQRSELAAGVGAAGRE